jgi:beta-RFAP synthase
MIHVRTPSRLHFGLLAPTPPGPPDAGERRFGGVGLMVNAPGVELSVEPAGAWSAEGPSAPRALAAVRELLARRPELAARPHRVLVRRAAPEHRGLGTGTQLALAVARAVAEACGWAERSAAALAPLVDRGRRSALGVHGFDRGGLLVDGGKHDESGLAPLVARADVPAAWRIVLLLPPGPPGLHGQDERDAFARLAGNAATTDALCRLVLLGLLPALHEQCFDEFSESLHAYNRLAGEAFAPVQGGVYASRQVAELVAWLRGLGVRGAGQSSWGPAVFALAADEDQARWLAERARAAHGFAPHEVVITSANNTGAQVRPDGRAPDA